MEFKFEDMPEEIRKGIEHQMLHNESHHHEIKNFIAFLDEDQLTIFYVLLKSLNSSPDSVAYYAGVVANELQHRFNVCLACGRKHSDELKDMVSNSEEKND